MNSDSPSLQQLIQSGDPQAIAQVLSKSFAAGGVKIAKCDRQGSTLRMLLVGEKIDQQQKHAIKFLKQQFTKQEISSISKIKVYGQKPSEMMPLWDEEIHLVMETPDEDGFDDFDLEDHNPDSTNDVPHITQESPPPIPDDTEELPPPLPVSPATSPSYSKAQSQPPKANSNVKPKKPPMPPSRLGMAIGSIFLFFPIGIPALIVSNQVSSKYYFGDYRGAKSSSDLVKLLFIVSASIFSTPIVILLITAMILPSFLNQANDARESEAKQYVGSLNRAQQAHYLERTRFTDDIDLLGLGIQSETTNYIYELAILSESQVVATGTPKNPSLRGYTGSIFLVDEGSYETTTAIVCEAKRPSTTPPAPPLLVDGEPTCAAGSEILE